MNPAEELRAAATRMRELAEAAPSGTWYATTGPEDTAHVWGKTASIIPEHVAQIDSDDADRDIATAQHMATWHPAVALAVAAWLDHQAVYAETHRAEVTASATDPETRVYRCAACGVSGSGSPRHVAAWADMHARIQFPADADALAVARAFMGGGEQ